MGQPARGDRKAPNAQTPKLPPSSKALWRTSPRRAGFQGPMRLERRVLSHIITYYHILSGITTSGEKNGEDGEFERSRQPGRLHCFGDGLEDLTGLFGFSFGLGKCDFSGENEKKFGLVGFYRFLLGREKANGRETEYWRTGRRGYHVRGICRTYGAQKGQFGSRQLGCGGGAGSGCRSVGGKRKEAWGLQGYRALFRNYAEVKRGGEEWKTSNARRRTSIAKRQRTAAIQDAGARFRAVGQNGQRNGLRRPAEAPLRDGCELSLAMGPGEE